MRKVPYFAGCLLAIGSVVVALNWDRAVPAHTHAEMAMPATAPDWVETAQLYSAFGPDPKTTKTTESEPTSMPAAKLRPQTSAKVEPA
jgi:hypothetical protein